MATKVTILGEEQPQKGKKIEFVKMLWSDLSIKDAEWMPEHFDNVILISKHHTGDCMDLMFAYQDGYKDGLYNNALYLGHFNDGIV